LGVGQVAWRAFKKVTKYYQKMSKKVIWVVMIISELIFGLILGLSFIKLFSNWDNFYGKTYFSGIFIFYGLLSIVFFLAVFLIGIFGAIKLGKLKMIKRAIFYSIGLWIISLIVYSTTFGYFSYYLKIQTIPIFMILIGIIIGFNLGLESKPPLTN
jgi:hypothetical protein